MSEKQLLTLHPRSDQRYVAGTRKTPAPGVAAYWLLCYDSLQDWLITGKFGGRFAWRKQGRDGDE